METAAKIAVKIQLDTASWRFPLIPWPLVQPSASRAPKSIRAPPAKAVTRRLPREGPKRAAHIGGTLIGSRSRPQSALASAPRKTPITSAHSQPRTSSFSAR